jgi:hypothetical protein
MRLCNYLRAFGHLEHSDASCELCATARSMGCARCAVRPAHKLTLAEQHTTCQEAHQSLTIVDQATTHQKTMPGALTLVNTAFKLTISHSCCMLGCGLPQATQASTHDKLSILSTHDTRAITGRVQVCIDTPVCSLWAYGCSCLAASRAQQSTAAQSVSAPTRTVM